MSNVHRLRVTDCVFFVNIILRPRSRRFNRSEHDLLTKIDYLAGLSRLRKAHGQESAVRGYQLALRQPAGVPMAVTLEGSCNSNGAGIDLGDGTISNLGTQGMGGVTWKFP